MLNRNLPLLLACMGAILGGAAAASQCSHNDGMRDSGSWAVGPTDRCKCSNGVWGHCQPVCWIGTQKAGGTWHPDGSWATGPGGHCQCINRKWVNCKCQGGNKWYDHGAWWASPNGNCRCNNGAWSDCEQQVCWVHATSYPDGSWANGPSGNCQCRGTKWVNCKCQGGNKWHDHGAWWAGPNGNCRCNNGMWGDCEQQVCWVGATSYPDGSWATGPSGHCHCNNGKWEKCCPKKVNYALPTRQQFREQFAPECFKFDLQGRKPNVAQDGGMLKGLTVRDLPALFGEGMALTLFTLEPCGINLPHVHPRATEMIYVMSGSAHKPFLQTAFVEADAKGRTIVNTLKQGEATFFPKGLLHYQQNLGCEQTQYLSALNSEDPGVSTTTFALVSLPTEALAATLGQQTSYVAQLVKGLPKGPAQARTECLKKCGISSQA